MMGLRRRLHRGVLWDFPFPGKKFKWVLRYDLALLIFDISGGIWIEGSSYGLRGWIFFLFLRSICRCLPKFLI
jgi:hypothetical protein